MVIQLNREGAKQFAKVIAGLRAQGEAPGEERDRLAIVLDGVVYSAPYINLDLKRAAQRTRMISEARITGVFNFDEAKLLAILLRVGALGASVYIIEEATF